MADPVMARFYIYFFLILTFTSKVNAHLWAHSKNVSHQYLIPVSFEKEATVLSLPPKLSNASCRLTVIKRQVPYRQVGSLFKEVIASKLYFV